MTYFNEGEKLKVIATHEELEQIHAKCLFNNIVTYIRTSMHNSNTIKIHVCDEETQFQWWLYPNMVERVNTKPFEGNLEFDIYV